MDPFRAFAVVPAAGLSARMGQPKLLLPVGDSRLIERALQAWRATQIDEVVVVVRSGDPELAEACRASGATVVVPPTAPPEMRDSVSFALRRVQESFAPTGGDVWLLAPADMPHLSPQIVEALLAAHEPENPRILVPTIGGRRGHPVLFPWPLAGEVFSLAPGEGLNVLRARHASREIACDLVVAAGINPFADVDTPEDYENVR